MREYSQHKSRTKHNLYDSDFPKCHSSVWMNTFILWHKQENNIKTTRGVEFRYTRKAEKNTKATTVNLIAYGNIFNQIKIKDRYQGSKTNIVLVGQPVVFVFSSPLTTNFLFLPIIKALGSRSCKLLGKPKRIKT